MRNILAIVLVMGFVVIIGPTTARADFDLTFSDNTETPQWIFGSLPPFACTIGPLVETCTATNGFAGESFASTINLAFNIYDPGGVALSDTLQITAAAGSDTVVSTFISDVEGGPALAPLSGGTTIIEDGTVQRAATIALNGPFAGQNFLIQFQSDVDSVSTPEPSSLLLLATGLLGLALLGGRRVIRAA